MQKSSSLKEMNRTRAASLFVFFFALLLAGALIPSKFSVTLTPSVRYRVFYLDKSPDWSSIKDGDYVMFVLKDPRIEKGKPCNLIKEVGCSEGDTLTEKGKDYYCNGNEYLGRAKDLSLKGEKLDNFKFNGTVPKGMIYVFGDHRDSYDSRYFGFIRKTDIKAKAHPVF